VGTELGTVVALQDAVLAYTLPADAFVITGNKTARFSAKLADTGEPLPEWLHIDPRTGALTGTPQNGDVGTLRVKVTALQAEHQSASQVVTLQIGDANEAPVAVSGAAIEASSVRAGEVLSWALPAGLFTDADANDRLSLRVESADGSALPAWLRLNPVTNRLEGTPTNANAGALALRLVATDLSGAMAFVPFSIDILPGINRSPQVELGILDQQLVETKLWQFTLAANTFVDPDGDALTYSAVLGDGSALPDWMRFDGATQTFSGTPPDTASGLLAITVTATDQQGETASSSFSLDIANIVNGTALSEALAGTSLRDYIDGLAGADTMAGGAGNDTYVVDNAGDVVTENAAEGIDTVMSSVNHILKANAENLTLTGTANIYGLGNELDNLLTGNSGNNILEGGAGIDTMIGGLGDDTYYVSIGDVIIENANEGTDTVVSGINYTLGNNIENLTLSNEMRGLTGTGNGLANRIKGTFYADVIDGGAGADSMTGGRGNDSYYVDNAGDVVAEAANEGTDTVLSSVSYTLSANVKNLTLLGATAINGTGNGTKNILTGNAADNILDGGAGADTLDGGAGADVMLGGKGIDVYIVDNQADTVIESAGEGTDTVYASVSYALTDNVENLVLTGSANINAVGNAGNNRLEGNAGNNILFGGLGNDTYVFGRGSGQDIVANFDAGKPAGDVVQLAAGLADADMDYVRAGNDLLLSIKGTSDQLTVADYFENGGKDDNTLEKIRFADGTSLNHGAVLNRTTAMGRTSVDAEVPEAPGMLAAMRAGDPTSLFDAPAPAASKPSDASITPQSVAESINAARERFEQGLKNLKLGTDELGGLSRGESAARGALPLLWNLQDALLSLQLAKNADGRFTADVSIDSRATRDLGLGISLLGATTGINGRLEQVARPAEVQQFDLAQLH
jgi:Ca2+-binding RTX toxin-like protein